jgi:aerobic carbon-monoxide dehydrogenase large subunit
MSVKISKSSKQDFKGRREDQRLTTGRGRYTADHDLPGQAFGSFLRADRAHARIIRIDTAAALELEGVVGILTGSDIVAAGLKSPPPISFFKGVNGTSLHNPYRPALAHERVRFVGEPVALVVAETHNLTQDAAELIEVEYEDLPVLVDADEALSARAVQLHADVPGNLALEFAYGDSRRVERGFANAAHVVAVTLNAQRIAGNPMEPKSCVARYDESHKIFDVYLPSQGTADLKTALAHVTGLDRGCFRIHSIDVGGGFGVRNEIYPEYVAVLQAARQFGRAVKWTGTRSETLSGDHHGRAAKLKGEIALDRAGKFLALRVEWLVNLGAYCSNAGPLINTATAPVSSATSLYNVPAVYGRHKLVFTNTTPTTAYRGAGRPNVAYLWERLVEEAARKVGIDSIELRRRNLLVKEQFPFRTVTGALYDSADPAGLLDGALQEADWINFEARRLSSRKNGRLRGIGLALFITPSGGAGKEGVSIKIGSEGRLALYAHAGPTGQGHETVFPDVVAHILGLPADRIELRYNDVAMPALAGTGSYGSRSLISHGNALALGAREIVRKAQDLAAQDLEVSPGDLVFDNGRYRVPGTDLSIGLEAIMARHVTDSDHPLDTTVAIDTAGSFPSGAHIAELEIDPETGVVDILKYVAVDDCGTIYNQVIVEGQLHGGLMQSIGQVLGEEVTYDAAGQLLSGTFMDYFMPRARHLPEIILKDLGTPSPANSLGAKGAGEAGATGAIPAIANAVFDALKPLQIFHVEMPFTPSRIWSAIHQGKEAPGGK